MLVSCQCETGMWSQTTSSQVSHDTEFIITRKVIWQPKGRSWLSRQFYLRRHSNWNPNCCCVFAVGMQRQNRPGRSALALCTQICDDLLPKHLAENKCPQARQSSPTMQSAWKWAGPAAEPELASLVPEAVLSKRKSTSTARILGGSSPSGECPGRALYGMGDLTCWNGYSLTNVPLSVLNWLPEIKVICGSKDRVGVGGNQLCF